jgi:hypothetical protein
MMSCGSLRGTTNNKHGCTLSSACDHGGKAHTHGLLGTPAPPTHPTSTHSPRQRGTPRPTTAESFSGQEQHPSRGQGPECVHTEHHHCKPTPMPPHATPQQARGRAQPVTLPIACVHLITVCTPHPLAPSAHPCRTRPRTHTQNTLTSSAGPPGAAGVPLPQPPQRTLPPAPHGPAREPPPTP